MPEMRRNADGSTIEVMPDVLDCGHPSEGNVESISFAAETVDGERVRTYRCRTCGETTFSPTQP